MMNAQESCTGACRANTERLRASCPVLSCLSHPCAVSPERRELFLSAMGLQRDAWHSLKVSSFQVRTGVGSSDAWSGQLEIMWAILFASIDNISRSINLGFFISLRIWVGDRQIVLQILKSYMNCRFFSFHPLLTMKESVLHALAIQG